jgi:hypothetical protein
MTYSQTNPMSMTQRGYNKEKTSQYSDMRYGNASYGSAAGTPTTPSANNKIVGKLTKINPNFADLKVHIYDNNHIMTSTLSDIQSFITNDCFKDFKMYNMGINVHMVVLSVNQSPVAMCFVELKPAHYEIHTLCVSKMYHRKLLCSSLIHEVLVAYPHMPMKLWVVIQPTLNIAAEKCYKNLGFVYTMMVQPNVAADTTLFSIMQANPMNGYSQWMECASTSLDVVKAHNDWNSTSFV